MEIHPYLNQNNPQDLKASSPPLFQSISPDSTKNSDIDLMKTNNYLQSFNYQDLNKNATQCQRNKMLAFSIVGQVPYTLFFQKLLIVLNFFRQNGLPPSSLSLTYLLKYFKKFHLINTLRNNNTAIIALVPNFLPMVPPSSLTPQEIKFLQHHSRKYKAMIDNCSPTPSQNNYITLDLSSLDTQKSTSGEISNFVISEPNSSGNSINDTCQISIQNPMENQKQNSMQDSQQSQIPIVT